MAKETTPRHFVKAKSSFLHGGSEVKPGTIIEVKKHFGQELVNSRMVEWSTLEAYEAGKVEVEKGGKKGQEKA
jgi:hypothetical protein